VAIFSHEVGVDRNSFAHRIMMILKFHRLAVAKPSVSCIPKIAFSSPRGASRRVSSRWQQAGGPREVQGLQLVEMTTAAAPGAISLSH
jgi:hypothetical protein